MIKNYIYIFYYSAINRNKVSYAWNNMMNFKIVCYILKINPNKSYRKLWLHLYEILGKQNYENRKQITGLLGLYFERLGTECTVLRENFQTERIFSVFMVLIHNSGTKNCSALFEHNPCSFFLRMKCFSLHDEIPLILWGSTQMRFLM